MQFLQATLQYKIKDTLGSFCNMCAEIESLLEVKKMAETVMKTVYLFFYKSVSSKRNKKARKQLQLIGWHKTQNNF